jgi:hypothetical protein
VLALVGVLLCIGLLLLTRADSAGVRLAATTRAVENPLPRLELLRRTFLLAAALSCLAAIYARLFRRLTWGQRLSYAVRMTHYWIGPMVGFHLIITMIVLVFPRTAIADDFEGYLAHLVPLAVATLLIRHVALRVRRHPTVPATAFMRAMTLVYATWPVYAIAWIMSLLRRQLGFRLTPKAPARGTPAGGWLAIQVATVMLLGAGLVHFLLSASERTHPLITCFAIAQCIPPVLLLWLAACHGGRGRYESEHTGREPLPQPSSI